MRKVVLDIETTGLHLDTNKIFEIGCVELWENIPTGNYFHVYINPTIPLSKESIEITGITDDILISPALTADFMHRKSWAWPRGSFGSRLAFAIQPKSLASAPLRRFGVELAGCVQKLAYRGLFHFVNNYVGPCDVSVWTSCGAESLQLARA